jgi:hypothetical protein
MCCPSLARIVYCGSSIRSRPRASVMLRNSPTLCVCMKLLLLRRHTATPAAGVPS